jgi:hypothetical protein
MRKSNVIGAAIALLLSVRAFGQATTKTILIDWNNQGSGDCSTFMGTRSTTFMDTAGSNWTSLKIRIPLDLERFDDQNPTQPGPPSTFSVAINGVPVGEPVVVTNHGQPCGPDVTYEFESGSLAGYHALGANTFTVSSVGGNAGNSGEFAELTFTTEPRTFAFDLSPSMSQRLLIHKRAEDTYPSPWQVETGFTDRPRFRFRGAVTATTGSAEADVWLRVIDPADPSLYLPARSPNDNQDPSPKGVLMPRGCADPSCRAPAGQPLRIHASPGGTVEVELEATDRYAGDDYYLEASFDAGFTCATAGANGADTCARSGLVTAWKRAYVETDRMFRNGSLLTDSIAEGGADPTVLKVASVAGFRARKGRNPGSSVMIVHASRGAGQPAYFEPEPGDPPLTVDSVDKKTLAVTLSRPLKHAYQAASPIWRSDGVGIVTGVDSNDYFTPNGSLAPSLFSGAFVDWVPAPAEAGECGCLPFFANFTDPFANDRIDMANLWNDHFGDPDVFHLVGASRSGDEIGERPIGTRVALIYLLRIETFKFINRANLNATSAAHELTHAWDVNSGFNKDGHCDQNEYADPSRLCLMRPGNDWLDIHNDILPQFYDGHVEFHFKSTAPGVSEYFEIRRHTEPIQ